MKNLNYCVSSIVLTMVAGHSYASNGIDAINNKLYTLDTFSLEPASSPGIKVAKLWFLPDYQENISSGEGSFNKANSCASFNGDGSGRTYLSNPDLSFYTCSGPLSMANKVKCYYNCKCKIAENACSGFPDSTPKSGNGWSNTSCRKFSVASCSYGATVYKNTCTALYSLSSCPSNGVCAGPDCAGKYSLTGCKTNYTKSGNSCVCATTCSDKVTTKPANSIYTYENCTACGKTTSIKSSWSCNSGYTKSGNSCACATTCSDKVSTKPANSTYTYESCTACGITTTIKSGWSCDSGYNKSGSSCVANCSLPNCTSISTKPANSSYTTGSCTDCNGTKTVNTGWACNSGYTKSGNSCTENCSLPTCSNKVSTKPANSNYTTQSCTDCSGTKTINTGWTCVSGYVQSGSSCVPEPSESESPACTLPACSDKVTTKPANSSYSIGQCTDCDGTKSIKTGWNCNFGYIKSGTTCVEDATPSPSPSPSESASPSSSPSVPPVVNEYTEADCHRYYGAPQSDGKCSPEYDGSHWTGSSNGCPRDEDCDCRFPSYIAHPECAQYYSGASCDLSVFYPMQGHSGC